MTQTNKQLSPELKAAIDATEEWRKTGDGKRSFLLLAKDDTSMNGVTFAHADLLDLVQMLIQAGMDNDQVATAIIMSATALTTLKSTKTEKQTEA